MNYDRKVAITLAALRVAENNLFELNAMEHLDDMKEVTEEEIDELCEEANVTEPVITILEHIHRHGNSVYLIMHDKETKIPSTDELVELLDIDDYDPDADVPTGEPQESIGVLYSTCVSDIKVIRPQPLPTILEDDLPEVDKVATLSTAHITKSDSDLLNVTPKSVMTDSYSYGHWVCLSEEMTTTDIVDEGYSKAFAALYLALQKQGFKWLRLDCDGPKCDKLPTFDW